MAELPNPAAKGGGRTRVEKEKDKLASKAKVKTKGGTTASEDRVARIKARRQQRNQGY